MGCPPTTSTILEYSETSPNRAATEPPSSPHAPILVQSSGLPVGATKPGQS